VKLEILEYGELFFSNSSEKVKLTYYIDSLHAKWDISSLYLLSFWWLWITAYENPKFKIRILCYNKP